MKTNTIGKLITDGLGKERLKQATVSKPRHANYIVDDWNYEDLFVDKLQINNFLSVFKQNAEQMFKQITAYIYYSKKYRQLPTIDRIRCFFEKKINYSTAQKIFNLIVSKQPAKFEYENKMKINSICEINNAKIILANKQLMIFFIKNKMLKYHLGKCYFNEIRVVKNKINNEIMILTNDNKLQIIETIVK